VARGKLKNRIKTFLGSPLCRGADELRTKQLASRCSLFAEMEVLKGNFMDGVQFGDQRQWRELCRENFELKTDNDRLKRGNGRPEGLMFYMEGPVVANNRVREQQESECANALQRTNCIHYLVKWRAWRWTSSRG
jgi:hypothetical protein